MSNNLPTQRKGILFVLSAPSGAGKSTLYRAVMQTETFAFSVSCTTRPRREGEIDGTDYHFLTEEAFVKKVEAGEFLEHALVHKHRYGTLAAPVIETLRQGKDVLMDIDIQGAAAIRAHGSPEIRDALADIFLLPPSAEELQHRLARRGTETPEDLAIRLGNADAETAHWHRYRYIIPNRTIEENVAAFRAILSAERNAARRYFSASAK